MQKDGEYATFMKPDVLQTSSSTRSCWRICFCAVRCGSVGRGGLLGLLLTKLLVSGRDTAEF